MSLDALLEEISACRACAPYLPHTPRPVTRVSAATRILIAGQAPGRLVHETGLPFNDPSGVRLRQWMGIDRETFYGRSEIGVAAMAFCFPGTNPKGGDYPPPPRCATLWRSQLLAALPNVELTLLVGSYAQDWALSGKTGKTMADTIANWRAFGPNIIPLPHPSWRNTAWLKRNPWFEAEVTPFLRRRVADILSP